jgi:hypothetical protein
MGTAMEVKAERTLVKSEPELSELIDADPQLSSGAVRVSLSESGFGTKVTIRAEPGAGFEEAELEQLLDVLAEPQKRPFSAS